MFDPQPFRGGTAPHVRIWKFPPPRARGVLFTNAFTASKVSSCVGNQDERRPNHFGSPQRGLSVFWGTPFWLVLKRNQLENQHFGGSPQKRQTHTLAHANLGHDEKQYIYFAGKIEALLKEVLFFPTKGQSLHARRPLETGWLVWEQGASFFPWVGLNITCSASFAHHTSGHARQD